MNESITTARRFATPLDGLGRFVDDKVVNVQCMNGVAAVLSGDRRLKVHASFGALLVRGVAAVMGVGVQRVRT